MKLGDSSKAMRYTFTPKIEQGLHKDVDLQRVVGGGLRGRRWLSLAKRVGEVAEDVQRFFGSALVADAYY